MVSDAAFSLVHQNYHKNEIKHLEPILKNSDSITRLQDQEDWNYNLVWNDGKQTAQIFILRSIILLNLSKSPVQLYKASMMIKKI